MRMIQSKPDSTILLMTASVVHQARAMLDLLNRYNWRALAVVTSTQTCSQVLTPDRSQPVSVVSVGLSRSLSVSVNLSRFQSVSVGLYLSRSQSVSVGFGLETERSDSVSRSECWSRLRHCGQSFVLSRSRGKILSGSHQFGLGVGFDGPVSFI